MAKKKFKVCKSCGEQFPHIGRKTSAKKFCSERCRLKTHILICEQCNNQFERKSFALNSQNRFCNKSCSNAWQHANGIRRDYLNDKSMKEWVIEKQGQERFEEIKQKQSKAKMGERNHRFGKSDHTKGLKAYSKTCKGWALEKIHGFEKATEIREKISKATSGERNPMYGKQQPKGGNSIKGWYKDRFFRSLLEYSFMKHLEAKSIDLNGVQYEHFRIPYIFREKNRTYRPDFRVGNVVYEIKQSFATKLPINVAKKEAAEKYLLEQGLTYIIVTENDITIMTKSQVQNDADVKLL